MDGTELAWIFGAGLAMLATLAAWRPQVRVATLDSLGGFVLVLGSDNAIG